MALQPWQQRGLWDGQGASHCPKSTSPARWCPGVPGGARCARWCQVSQVCQVKVLLPWGLSRDLAVTTMEGSPLASALRAARARQGLHCSNRGLPRVLPLGPGTRVAGGTGHAESSSAVGSAALRAEPVPRGQCRGDSGCAHGLGEGKGVQGDLRLRRGEHICFDSVRLSPEAPRPSLIHPQGRAAWGWGTGRGPTGHSPTQPPGVLSSSPSVCVVGQAVPSLRPPHPHLPASSPEGSCTDWWGWHCRESWKGHA